MFAPKFRSWMTDDERFAEAQEWRINLAADAALKEIREMAKAAMLPEPDERSQEVLLLDRLYNQWPSGDLLPYEAQARNQAFPQDLHQSLYWAYPAYGHSTGLEPESVFQSAPMVGWRTPW